MSFHIVDLDVPHICPCCDGDGSEARMFDGGCPAEWTHALIAEAKQRTAKGTASGEPTVALAVDMGPNA